jgi:hypothetical protein
MKRNLKPFTVEIKKSRIPGQHHQLPPKRLFATLQVEVPKSFRKEEPQAVAEQPAPRRILPSIVESVWSRSEPVEPVRRTRASRSKVEPGQMELDLHAISTQLRDASAETPVISEGMSQADVSPAVKEDAQPVHGAQIQKADAVKAKSRKPRREASEVVEQVVASEPVAELAPAPQTEAVDALSVVPQRRLGRHSLTKRQAAAGRLPRHERWKRRLHPACW